MWWHLDIFLVAFVVCANLWMIIDTVAARMTMLKYEDEDEHDFALLINELRKEIFELRLDIARGGAVAVKTIN